MRMLMPYGTVLAASLGFASLGFASFGVASLGFVVSAYAANPIQKECSQKYQAAKAANTLNGMKYNDYYKQCAAAAKAAPAPAAPAAPTPTTTAPAPAPAPVAPTTTAARPTKPMTTSAPAPAATGAVVFPTALSSQFSSESAGKARMHTCLAQYNANKANSGTGNGGLKWIMKGGGYYSECNKRLKS